MLDEAEIRLGVACAAVVASLVVAAALRVPDTYVHSVVLILAGVLGATLTRPLAAFLGLSTWAFFTGFVTNEYGVLTFAVPDLVLLAELTGLAVVASHLARQSSFAPAESLSRS